LSRTAPALGTGYSRLFDGFEVFKPPGVVDGRRLSFCLTPRSHFDFVFSWPSTTKPLTESESPSVYDVLYRRRDNPETVADFFAPLAGKRRAPELGIGTGRIAIAPAARGVGVVGSDASPAMIARMRAKPVGAGHSGRNGKLRRCEGYRRRLRFCLHRVQRSFRASELGRTTAMLSARGEAHSSRGRVRS
jgi:SAM-dependent methyltransferase